jgi:hypothetical protein
VDVVYSTLAAGFGTAQALRCSGEGTRTIRNSILFAEADEGEIDCPDASIQQSALESAYGDGNVAVGSVDTGAWFVDFARGDLHLDPEVAAPMFAAVATWAEGDPRDDLDGDARPFVNGAMDWCGADLP